MCLIDSCVVLCKCVFGNSVSHKYSLSRAPARSLFLSPAPISFLFLFPSVSCTSSLLSGRVLPVCVALFSSYVSFVRVPCRYECSPSVYLFAFLLSMFFNRFYSPLVVSVPVCLFVYSFARLFCCRCCCCCRRRLLLFQQNWTCNGSWHHSLFAFFSLLIRRRRRGRRCGRCHCFYTLCVMRAIYVWNSLQT